MKKIIDYVKTAHANQFRKDGTTPYWTHPIRVGQQTEEYTKSINPTDSYPWQTKAMVEAAYLHDVVEDTKITAKEISQEFGELTSYYVTRLTNKSILEKINASRAERKKIDREWLSTAPREVKIVKLIDRLDNISDMYSFSVNFKKLYVDETFLLLEVIQDADHKLADQVARAAIEAIRKTQETS